VVLELVPVLLLVPVRRGVFRRTKNLSFSPLLQLLFTSSLKSAGRRSSSQTLVRWPMKFLAAISKFASQHFHCVS